jgi:secreted trypsin-like serine protease
VSERKTDVVFKNKYFLHILVFPDFRGKLPKIDEKIVGGDEVTPNSLPYQGSFQYDYAGDSFFHFCGGIVYSETHAITAAHCCDGQSASGLQFAVGEHNLFQADGTESKVQVRSLYMHEEYSTSDLSNDICIIEFAERIQMDR